MRKPRLKIVLWAMCAAMAFPLTGLAENPDSPKTFKSHLSDKKTPFVPLLTADEQGSPLPAVPVSGFTLTPRTQEVDPATVPLLYGSVIASKDSPTGTPKHATGRMYSFTADGLTFTLLNTNGNVKFGGGTMDDGFYYAMRASGANTYIDKFNVNTWKRTSASKISSKALFASDVAYDPTSDMVYGSFYNDTYDGYVFGRADYKTRKRYIIKPLEVSYNAVMVDSSGQVYAIDMTGNLLKIDKTTGEATTIGQTGVIPRYTSSGIIDLATDRCYWTVSPADGNSYLYEVNLQTGEAMLISQFPNSDEITGLYLPIPAPAATAPAAIENFTASFTDGSLSGTVSFTVPTKTVAGDDLTGTLTYKVWVDGVLRFEEATTPGAEVSLPIELDNAGIATFVASITGEGGVSARAKAKSFLGNDTPKAPAPTLAYADGSFNIAWEKVTGTVNGGYINPDQLTYTVTRYPDATVVADGISELSYSDPVAPTPGRVIAYYYTVSATFAGNKGAAGKTSVYPLGEIEAPWHEGFDSEEAMNNFIIIDGDADGVTWKYSGSMSSAYITNSNADHDDWLISAAIRMRPGVNYKLNFSAMASFSPEKLEVKMGNAPTAAAMTKTLVEPTVLEADCSFEPQMPEFTVDEEGTYYIGWHAMSPPENFYLYLDNIALTSDEVIGGDAVTPPYREEFNESAALEKYTVVDANNDGFTWAVDRGVVKVTPSTQVDDWLITPPVSLKEGSRYEVSALCGTQLEQPGSTVTVCVGNAATVEAMTEEVIPATSVVPAATLKQYFTAPADGEYYFGFHASGEWDVYIDYINIAAPLVSASPAAVTDAVITPAPYGELKGELWFKAPETTMDGDPLASLSKIEVLENSNVVYTFDAPATGSELNCTLTTEETGTHTYTIVAYSGETAGVPVEVSAYLGVNIPAIPTDVVMTEEGNTGKVTLTWTAPTTDVNGVLMRPEDISFIVAEVVNGQLALLARDIHETSYTFQAVAPDKQDYKTYAVLASSSAGNSQGVVSNAAPVGKPDVLPYVESFVNGIPAHVVVSQVIVPQGGWNLYNDHYFDINSADNDNGFAVFSGNNANATGVLFTGKISIEDQLEPELSFYIQNVDGEYPDVNEVIVQAMDAEGTVTELDHFVINEKFGDNKGWNKVIIPLTDFNNKTIRLAFASVIKGYTQAAFDNFRIEYKTGTGMNIDGIVSVEGGHGCISINGAENSKVGVFDIQGAVIFSGEGTADMSVPCGAGIYVVVIDGVSYKVVVK